MATVRTFIRKMFGGQVEPADIHFIHSLTL